ncbi:MAG: CDGSH iron-sulfur domain-containing protein [Chroococcidiopsidaceae cyanobacterium CP_BM_ER_R8_30]|nr:CDGSH iron-sulfur domain-containing protein [Chroococcidiopsidaceae cyanobacterium CP_BM_ER_R8_30]
MAEATKITTLDNGPFLVTGPVLLTDAAGQQFHSERETIALCRCGASTTKPFCDGTHGKIGFSAAERAVKESSGQA